MFKLILIATLVALSCAYDFKDSEFNQMILQDSSLRTKRDTELKTGTEDCHHGGWKKDLHCCNGDTVDKVLLEKVLEAKHECAKEVWGPDEEPSYDPFNCEQLREVKDKVVCLAECVTKKMDLLDDKGTLKRDALVEHMKTLFKDTEWKVKAAEGIVDKCLASFDSTTVVADKCNPSSMHMTHCTWKEFIRACPKDLQDDRWKCKKIREKLEKGDENYLNRIHFHKFIRHHDHHEHDTVKKTE